jgi:hypothetical protein
MSNSTLTYPVALFYVLLLIGGLWAFGAFWLAYTHTPTGEFGQSLVVFFYFGLGFYWLGVFTLLGIHLLVNTKI